MNLWRAYGFVLFFAAGCSLAQKADAPPTGSSPESILGGTVIPDTEFPSVVRVFTHGPEACDFKPERAALCSGTLIGQSTVLTAAHCVLGAVATESWIMTGSTVAGTATDRAFPGTPAGRFFASSIEIHPAIQAKLTGGEMTCTSGIDGGLDVAIIHLATPVPVTPKSTGIDPSQVLLALPSFGFAMIGRPVTQVGAGFSAGWDGDGNTDYGVRRKGTAAVAPEEWSTEEDAKVCTPTGGSFDLMTQPSIVRPGDSGGPAFIKIAGKDMVFGIHSWGGIGPADHMAPTYSTANASFLRQALGIGGSTGPDVDCDGISDVLDDCATTWNFYQEDGDGDLVGDVCDNCAVNANPGQENCNEDAEKNAGVDPVGDVCDPVPCLRSTQTAKQGGGPYVKYTDSSYFDVEPIRVKPAGGNDFRGAWGHRFCECKAPNPTPATCALSDGCTFDSPFDPDGPNWKYTEDGINDPPVLDATFEHDFRAPAEVQPGGIPATLDLLSWNAGSVGTIFSVTGSHWFHVKKEVCASPPCPASGVSQETLDTLASHYWAGTAGSTITFTGVAMKIPEIFGWWTPPVPDCVMCGALLTTPVAHVLTDRSLVMRGPAGDYPIGDQLSEKAQKTLLETSGVQWLSPAEPSALLEGASVRLASVKADGSAVGPIFAAARSGGLDVVSTPALRLETPGPGARSAFGAVLRATVGDLVVIGGVSGKGEALGDVWRYAVDAGRWSVVTTDNQIKPGAVLAATYDAFTRRLLVLDDVGTGTDRHARLFAIDTSGGATTLLGSWPRSGAFVSFALGHAHDGSVMLLASKGVGLTLKVARLIAKADGVVLDRIATFDGAPLAPPRTGPRGVDLLLNRVKTEAEAVHLDWARLAAPTSDDTLAAILQ